LRRLASQGLSLTRTYRGRGGFFTAAGREKLGKNDLLGRSHPSTHLDILAGVVVA
jgi:hypothetical protein